MGDGLCDDKTEHAYTVNDPKLTGEKYLKFLNAFICFAGAKTSPKLEQSDIKFLIHSRSHFSITQKFDPKIPHP